MKSYIITDAELWIEMIHLSNLTMIFRSKKLFSHNLENGNLQSNTSDIYSHHPSMQDNTQLNLIFHVLVLL